MLTSTEIKTLSDRVGKFDFDAALKCLSGIASRLSLNLEANVMVLDRDFNRHLSERLEALIRNSCRLIEATELPHSNTWLMVRSFFVFHFLRHFPSWAGWLPRHAPKVQPVDPRSGRIA